MVFGLWSDHMGGKGFLGFWRNHMGGGGGGTENSLPMKFHLEGES